MPHTAMIIDIVNSKKMSPNAREEIQVFIKQSLAVLNRLFRPSLVFPVIFSAGDEVQGLFSAPHAAFMYFRLISMILSPLPLRCGIGVGDWDVKIVDGTSAEQDGSAYHLARNAISLSHKQAGSSVLFNSDTENDAYINTLLNVSWLLIQEQRAYQNQVYVLTELMQPFYDKRSMDDAHFVEVSDLVSGKYTLNYYINRDTLPGNVWRDLKKKDLSCDPVFILSESILDTKMTFGSTLKKGLSKKISNITNTTRQNMDMVIKNSKLLTIRHIDLTAIVWIHRHFRG
ncbi:SatD family protein [Dehalobacter sp. DCM]|uniref:SatD family protein n=1 Tax=Dehalobacter sp. DCM TaxID=2907827 RepID=UPI0030819675|nr:SatD family protein [Dehalobacter sp. DCM]